MGMVEGKNAGDSKLDTTIISYSHRGIPNF